MVEVSLTGSAFGVVCCCVANYLDLYRQFFVVPPEILFYVPYDAPDTKDRPIFYSAAQRKNSARNRRRYWQSCLIVNENGSEDFLTINSLNHGTTEEHPRRCLQYRRVWSCLWILARFFLTTTSCLRYMSCGVLALADQGINLMMLLVLSFVSSLVYRIHEPSFEMRMDKRKQWFWSVVSKRSKKDFFSFLVWFIESFACLRQQPNEKETR